MKSPAEESPGTRARDGRLVARPRAPGVPGPRGRQSMQVGGDRDALLYVPASYSPNRGAPLAVMLHGAGGDANGGLALLQGYADAAGLILIAPASTSYTWDVLVHGYGPDVVLIDTALARVFDGYTIDTRRIAIGGFSDGASYGLGVGLANGELFTHVMAFSPGFIARSDQEGMPRVFVSHGTRDEVLPIDACSRIIVPELRHDGYAVEYHEFDGPHTVPTDMRAAAVRWFLA